MNAEERENRLNSLMERRVELDARKKHWLDLAADHERKMTSHRGTAALVDKLIEHNERDIAQLGGLPQ